MRFFFYFKTLLSIINKRSKCTAVHFHTACMHTFHQHLKYLNKSLQSIWQVVRYSVCLVGLLRSSVLNSFCPSIWCCLAYALPSLQLSFLNIKLCNQKSTCGLNANAHLSWHSYCSTTTAITGALALVHLNRAPASSDGPFLTAVHYVLWVAQTIGEIIRTFCMF